MMFFAKIYSKISNPPLAFGTCGPPYSREYVPTPSEPRMVSVRADLQPNTSSDIPLSQVEGFTEGNYFIHIRQGGKPPGIDH